eukprot:TRINITY_DN33246_c0_g1_i1.p1 TRINITY_DN33246_c0_g1~~TRINITY_DN33246_c0_g1_i1.p1  ORF type:complete len:420 (-),score=108.41 TRINITY_DN33246_c0_g1_i1:790-1956(-)
MAQAVEGLRVHPKCVNASNSFHVCSEFCFKRIAQQSRPGSVAPPPPAARSAASAPAPPLSAFPTEFGRKPLPKIQRQSADDAVTSATLARSLTDREGPSLASNDRETAVNRASAGGTGDDVREEDAEEEREMGRSGGQGAREVLDGGEGFREGSGEQEGDEDAEEPSTSYVGMTDREKRLFDLQLKLNQARRANQSAVVAEKKAADRPEESRGVSRQKWYEEKKRKIGSQLDRNGLEMKEAFMLDTQEEAEAKYKKWNKKEAAFGWDVFNQASLYRAYKKRTKNIEVDMAAYSQAKKEDPDFFRDSASLEYGKDPGDTPEGVDRMVRELEERSKVRKDFSRRRRYHEEKDIDSINDRNEHFNRKIERAFGKYTVEIKNNLERGTALPD